MESLRSKHVVLLITLMILKLLSTDCRNPVLHRVGGGRNTWSPGVNLTDWAVKEQFYVGDWLYFGFDKWSHNVLEVNKSNYENCEERDFVTNVTRGGRDVFNLTEPKVYYFLCGRGFCSEGMKVEIPVWLFPLLQPHDDHNVQQNNGFPSNTYGFFGQFTLIAMLVSALTCILLPL
ncbi:Lamin-like protein [Morus notabilis]|uniref:Lamin-like protein n=1 Tax=Morus notabilis TaxID=981085 RepID=W9QUT4_9ROSA|nr:lamin-like protein [Morus notabilis]EXB54655.1 Lamin-like protein [Morus notabilis]